MFYSERLKNAPRSSAAARRIVERLEPELDAETLANLRLLVSELVTNAIEHVPGDQDIAITVSLRGDRVRVEVNDGGPGFTYRKRESDDPKGSGWGLHFVDLLSESWGAMTQDGASVWFEMPVRAAPRRP
jgi:anti-sigma regulatory factor (Ser/Thr protein kinase)